MYWNGTGVSTRRAKSAGCAARSAAAAAKASAKSEVPPRTWLRRQWRIWKRGGDSKYLRATIRQPTPVGTRHALQVHVEPQEEAGVRDVAPVHDVLHVPYRTVERRAQLREARDQPP